ncbi:DUF438 domain-containing protein [Loigolactobacillus zhaoyuanensis]|uniref:DUF438 domain-containing protein n=1 Tax=Loigolactobacillus zhaoyuanensis TaxID=2486017 RepID=UPI000F74A17C|nr:DUF438 domain-containing protein [Loigolactobacillus zhaoyuanensis]
MPDNEHNSVYRQKKIVEILKMLHAGGSFDEAKQIFDSTFSSVDVSEITSAERELIGSGLNPMEIQRLCNVHAAVFKGSINPGSGDSVEEVPGHPVAVIKLENTVITSLLDDELVPVLKKWQQSSDDATPSPRDQEYLQRMKTALADLRTIDKHYARKENLLFPIMDRYGITAPPKVMWGVDDDIRGWIKDAIRLVNAEPTPAKYDIETAIEKAKKDIEEMIFKEEQILLPMVAEVFTPDDWALIQSESADIGYTLIPEPLPWQPSERDYAEAAKRKPSKMAQELNAMAQSMADEQDLKARARPTTPATATEDAESLIPDDLKAKQDDPAALAALPLHLRAEMGQVKAEKPAKEDARAQINVNISQPPAEKKEMPEFVKQMLADEAAKPAHQRRPRITESHLEIGADNHATIVMPTGDLDLSQLTALFGVLPVDITFVDANDIVRWFSDNGDRIFPRTRAVIGRAVVNCHPPKSMGKVQVILDDFRSGAQDHADFWINLHGTKKVYIRYFAVRSPKGEYLGCLEVSQDITEIQQLTDEKRL